MSFLTSRATSSSATALRRALPIGAASLPASRRGLARMTIIGRLGDTPEIGTTNSGVEMIRYAVATNFGPPDNRQTSWWKVATFNPSSGLKDLMLALGKGSMVAVDGECNISKYVDREGQQRESLGIKQRSFEILERRSSEDKAETEAGDA